MSQSQNTNLRQKISWGGISLAAVFIMIFIMGLLKIYSPDLGFHLKSAEWILSNRQFIYTDTFSYGTASHPYFDHQWMYQIFVYLLYKKSASYLIIANAILITGSLVLVWWRFLQEQPAGKKCTATALFALMLAVFVQPFTFEIRPYVVSGILLNLVLMTLAAYKKENNKKVLFWLPVIMIFWVNIHSLAIIGLVIIGIYIAGGWLEKGAVDKVLLLFGFISFCAFLINPYFIKGLLFTLSQFGIISGNSLFKNYLGELQSPFASSAFKQLGTSYFASPLSIIHLSALLSVFTIFQALRAKHYTNVLLLAAFLLLAYLAIRNYSIFLQVSLPMFVNYFINWMNKRQQKKMQTASVVSKKNADAKARMNDGMITGIAFKRLSIAAVVIAVLISITTVNNGYAIFRHSPNRFGLESDKDQLPVEATDFLLTKNIKGKLLNHLDFGGYLMAHYDEKVFIDGRMDLYEDDFFRKYYESLTQRNGLGILLQEINPEVVVFPYIKAAYWWDYFVSKGAASGYRAVYFDGLSVIFLKSGVYPELKELNENTILSSLDTALIKGLSESFENRKPEGLAVFMRSLWQPQFFSISCQNRASYCFANGFDKAALIYSAMGIEASTVHTPNIFGNLATYYSSKKMFREAQLCQEKSE